MDEAERGHPEPCQQGRGHGTQDIADAILLVLALPRRANVCQVQVRPTIDIAPM